MKKNKLQSKKNNKIFFIILPLLLVIIASCLVYHFNPDPFFQAKKQMYSLSKGDQYYGRLSLWYLYAKSGQWPQAYQLETKLDPVDIQNYKNNNDPQKISQTLENIKSKKNKNVQDWVEMARLQVQLNQKQEAVDSITEARKLDPVRDDISKLYFQLSQ